MIDNEFNDKLEKLLDDKIQKMVEMLNEDMTDTERYRFGENIIRMMPNKGDLAYLKMELLHKFNYLDSEDYYKCERCDIDSSSDRMIPCPRGGCEAEVCGEIVKHIRLK